MNTHLAKQAEDLLLQNPEQNAYLLLRLKQGGIGACWLEGQSVCLWDKEYNKYLYAVAHASELAVLYETIRQREGELISFLSDSCHLPALRALEPHLAFSACVQLRCAPFAGELPQIEGVTFGPIDEAVAKWIPTVYQHPELTPAFLANRTKNGPHIAAFKENRPVGFFLTHSAAELGPVYVAPEMRGTGLASALYARIASQLPAEEALPVLFVFTGNMASRSYLSRMGCVQAPKETLWWWRANS